MRILAAIAVIVVAAAGVIVTRAAGMESKQLPPQQGLQLVPADADKLAAQLAGAIRFQTISSWPATATAQDFEDLHGYLAAQFPLVHKHLRRDLVGRSLMFTWPASPAATARPVLFLGHLDVVPAPGTGASPWSQPAFSGHNDGTYVWGRGAIDDKLGVIGLLAAAEAHLQAGRAPKRDIVFAFGADEETGGTHGATRMAQLLAQRDMNFEFAVDEGLPISKGVFPLLSEPLALIGVAEKGYLSVILEARGPEGHSSVPPPHTAAGILAEAITRLEANQMPVHLGATSELMFAYIGPHVPFSRRMAFANLWLFAPLVRRELLRNPATAASIRTTTAVTMLEGGIKDNVLPGTARAVVNFRIHPADTKDRVVDHITRTLNGLDVRIAGELDFGSPPSPVSSTTAPGFVAVHAALRAVFPEALVAPALVVGTTDARHYRPVCNDSYRVTPAILEKADIGRIHGADERVATAGIVKAVQFYALLIQQAGL